MKTNKAKRLFWAVMTVLLPMCAAATPATLSIEDFTISAGQTKEMLIDMNNPSDEITLVQFDLRLPAGLSIATEGGEMLIDIAGRTTWRKHSLNANTLGDITRFLLSSSTNAVISGNSGAVISIMLTASNNFNGGTIKLENQLLVTPTAVETKPADYSYTIQASAPETLEPYAVLSSDHKTLTFYYDGQKAARNGMDLGLFSLTFVGDRQTVTSGWDAYREEITTVVFDGSFANCSSITSTAYWFYKFSNLTAITGIINLNTSNVTDMSSMFSGCNILSSIDLSNFNTSMVTDLSFMFKECKNLSSLDVSHFDTSNVTKMTYMFYLCSGLTSLDLSNFNTSKVTNIQGMFRGCSNLTSLNVSHFDTKNVTDMRDCFYECAKLTSLDLSHFDTNNVTTMMGLFQDCSSLTSVNLSQFNTSKVTTMHAMFWGCSSLTTIDLSHFDTSNVEGMGYMFFNCKALTSVDLSNFKTGKVTNMNRMFASDNNLSSIYVGDNWNTNNVTESEFMFSGCTSIVGQDGTTYDPSVTDKTKAHYGAGGYLRNKNLPAGIAINTTTFPDENFRNWVLAQSYGQDGMLTEAEIAGVTMIDVREKSIVNLKGIEYFPALKELTCFNNQLTSLDVSKNTALTRLQCFGNKLTSLDITKNTALTNLECSQNQLVSLDVSKNTALYDLQCASNKLTSLDVSKNTALGYLRCNGNSLTSLDVSKNTALVRFFCFDNQLTSLDVSKNTALDYLMCDGNSLTTLDVSKNIALKSLTCNNNQLTSLDVSKNTALNNLHCNNNQINEVAMGYLVESLPANNGGIYVKNLSDASEQNVITTAQVAAAKAKGWTVYAWDRNAGSYGQWIEYNGDEPTMEPIETADFGSDIDGGTDLDGNVVGDILYNISSGDGSYNATEGCIVVTTPTDDSAINGQDIFGEDFQNNFTGIVFKVPEGKGTVKVEAQTTGAMVLKVKIGSADPVTMELEGRLKVSFPYNVSEPTYVYIYGGSNASAPGLYGAPATGELKLYGIEVTSDVTGISPIDHSTLNIEHYYTLDGRKINGMPTQKGIYIINGKKVVIK